MAESQRSPWKDAWVLMRIPFSVFLMPVYWFALLVPELYAQDAGVLILVFFIYHFLVYPASNGYNSYFDRDEQSIGGLEKPPAPNQKLFVLTILFDGLAVLLALLLSWVFAVLVAAYILVSKAYSWDKVRLKKYPITSLVIVTFFQGCFTYLSVQYAVEGNFNCSLQNVLLSLVATLFLMGSYPITQVYQHEEDRLRGDTTLSLMLGIRGTFVFSILCFLVATVLLISVFFMAGWYVGIGIYLVLAGPVAMYLIKWIREVWRHPQEASFHKTMKMNKTSSISLSATFIVLKVVSLFFPDLWAI